MSEHFVTNDHSDNITLELIKSNRDSVRKARVVYLIERVNSQCAQLLGHEQLSGLPGYLSLTFVM